jgi:hypothetical protein
MKNTNFNHNRTLPPFKKGKIICPVCGKKTDWHCALTIDDSLALCKYRWSDKQATDGRYIHHLKDDPYQPQKQTTVSTPAIGECGSVEVERADADHINVVYRTLLEHPILLDSEGTRPPLLPVHADHLLNERGFSDTAIAANLYTSVPDLKTLRVICDDLAGCVELKGVPGFLKPDGRWQLRYYGEGYLVPYRDAQGRITGIQVRLDKGDTRYKWLSSADKPEGITSGAPYHFAKPDLVRQRGFAFITEGALKADRIAEFTDKACIGLAGVDSFNGEKFGSELREALPDLRTVEIVFDIDWQENPEVKKALFRLRQVLRAVGLSANVRVWNAAKGKGFDDFLFNRERHYDNE